MRQVTPAAEQAIVDNATLKETGRLTIYKSRVFFKDEDITDHAPAYAHPADETGLRMPEVFAYNYDAAVYIEAMLNPEDGNLHFFFNNTTNDQPVATLAEDELLLIDPNSRMGIWGNSLFYFYDSAWHKATMDTDALSIHDGQCVSSDTVWVDQNWPGAIYPITETSAFICTIIDGGIAVIYVNEGDDPIICNSRFINPVKVLSIDNQTDLWLTHFGGAAHTTYGDFFYLTAHDGSVKSIKFSNGMFSDIQISIPSDLSITSVNNVFSYQDRIYLCARFERQKEFASDVKYTILTYSLDGVTFSMDRRIVVTALPYWFYALLKEDTSDLVFSAGNRYYSTPAPYQLVREDAPSQILQGISLDGDPMGGFNASLKSAANEYFDHPFLDTGTYAKLEIGVLTSSGMEYIKYHDLVVSTVGKVIGDGIRELPLGLTADGIWHNHVMTHPFYMEIQGRQGVYDPTKQFDNLYKFSGDDSVDWGLSVDLWPDPSVDDTGLAPQNHPANTTTDYWSRPLLDFLSESPKFGSDEAYVIKLYGWSRAGLPDTNPNTPDPTGTGTDNDKFLALIEVEDANGKVSTVVSTLAELSSTYQNPPQTYFEAGARAGSNPVVYNINNPGEGKKITRLGIRVKSTAGGPTVYYTERVEMPGITAQYKLIDTGKQQPFEIQTVKTNWPLVDTQTLTIGTDNDTNGNEVEMNYAATEGDVFAIAVVGKVAFRRNNIDYIQDAHFYASIDHSASPYAEPTWERSYPPGTGPTQNAAVHIKFSDWPYYPAAVLDKTDVVQDEAFDPNHAYVLHWADSRLDDSTVRADYIPYFYSDGTKIKVRLYLAGTGAISNIVGGTFKVYFFKSPKKLDDFAFFGGTTSEGVAAFQVPSSAPATIFAGQYNLDTNYTSLSVAKTMTADFTTGVLYIKNVSPSTAMKIKVAISVEAAWVDPTQVYSEGNHAEWNNGAGVLLGEEERYPETVNESANAWSKTISVPASTIAELSCFAGYVGPFFGAHFTSTTLKIEVELIGVPNNNQVPAPASFSLTIPVINITVTDDNLNVAMIAKKKGIPQIAFSTRPYSAFNFETTTRVELQGGYASAGLLGLASDQKNYIVGYMTTSKLGLAKVRDGIRTVLHEETISGLEGNKLFDVRFSHRDGLFFIEAKASQDFWPQRGSQFTYQWNGDTDGALCVQDDIFHVGIYAFIDPPKVRVIGHRSTQSILGVLPLDWDTSRNSKGFDSFPLVGKLSIDGYIYSYAGKNELSAHRGPFQLRNQTSWDSPFNSDRNGYTYQGGPAVELTIFSWWNGSGHALDYHDKVIATSEGYAWLVDQTLWKVWITTNHELVWLRNRARFYASDAPFYYATASGKLYLTSGFTNMRLTGKAVGEISHEHGAFAFVETGDKVAFHGFTGYSGEKDHSIGDLLEQFCKISGTDSQLYGDLLISSSVLDSGESVDLQ